MALIVSNQSRRGRHDVRGASEVLSKRNGYGIVVSRLEFQNIGDVRSSPRIDRLVGITHNTDVSVNRSNGRGNHELRVIGVLIFVYEQELIATSHVGTKRSVVTQRHSEQAQQIVKIERSTAG